MPRGLPPWADSGSAMAAAVSAAAASGTLRPRVRAERLRRVIRVRGSRACNSDISRPSAPRPRRM
eukprot:7407492-Alexandrium_andersonii.AAC.1